MFIKAWAEYCLRFIFLFSQWRCVSIKDLPINEEIRDKEVRVIDTDGSQLGIMSARDAYKIALEKNLDLVKIAPQATPPVCRIIDYGKYRFEQSKREKEARKNQKTIDIKEIRLSLNIDVNDFNTKVKQAIKFLEGGDKVKVSIRFRGREMAHPELGAHHHAAVYRQRGRLRHCGKAAQAGRPQHDHVCYRKEW